MQSQLDHLDQLKAQLDTVRHRDNDRIRQALELEYTYESNRIEGNTLTLRETDLVLNEGLTIGGKPLKDHLEAINHRDALDYMKDIVQQRVNLSERVLLDLHSLILRGIDRENAGRYRQVPVLIRGSRFVPPQPYLVARQMEDLFHWYENETKSLHPVVLAAELHERLVTIHPFIDGNGRTARLIMNLILLRHGFPLAILKGDADARITYYNALETAQTSGDKSDFIRLVADTVQAALERLLSLLR
ncbi:Fic family protein [Fibrisoma montanum]|uniref:Fic family protein n=1 Tax=Fibrisoma montanum TaxID=2305895 RepID=A0A418ME32_9BACT|nr:Fic family protein [Fibrisoma montanum]RIV25025.1 Fic family protein [Fibrisoma montanum]